MAEDSLQDVRRYHERTKHHLDRYAQSLGYLDWATQPNPFRHFDGAPRLILEHPTDQEGPSYDRLFEHDRVTPADFNRQSISRLFYDSLAISAWKQAPGSNPWSLRINPSSGCLHPTEGYLVAGPLEGLNPTPALYHYSPYRHCLEQRAVLSNAEWSAIEVQLPADSMLVALTSIYWRESWKYGERAFRYCHHDVGHAIGTIALAAATLGWRVELITSLGDIELGILLGVHSQQGIEAEHPDCLLRVSAKPAAAPSRGTDLRLPSDLLERLKNADLSGTPNHLSRDHHPWPIIDDVSTATRYPGSRPPDPVEQPTDAITAQVNRFPDRKIAASEIIRQRRSAVAMDGRTALERDDFFRVLCRVTPDLQDFPFATLPWRPRVSLALFVHRVEGLEAGLYLHVRHASHEQTLRESLGDDFRWREVPSCPSGVYLWQLLEADCRRTAKIVSCHQDIAADGAFSLGMLAEFELSLRREGAWFYPRLFWETGLIGQVLYLEAEAAGVSATGIGCFFDDAMHDVLGLRNRDWQSLYHFTVGGCREDLRIMTHPPYAHLSSSDEAFGDRR